MKLFFSEFEYENKTAFSNSYKKFILHEANFASHLHTLLDRAKLLFIRGWGISDF